jgi:prepilin signal peptidase PulO-like enzyme (type II secretory pathway)
MTLLWGSVLASFLLALSYVDLREFRLPDVLTFPLIILGLAQSYLAGAIIPALIGAVVGYTAFVAIAYAFKRLRGMDGLGRGDAKLLAAGGAWVGWLNLPMVVLIASLLGIVIALLGASAAKIRSDVPDNWVPFGPCLAVGIFAVWTATQIA